MFQLTLSQQVKDGMRELASLERVPKDRFEKIIEFCRQSIELSYQNADSKIVGTNNDTSPILDYSKEEFLRLAQCFNCFIVELVKHKATNEDLIKILIDLSYVNTQTGQQQSSASRETNVVIDAINDLRPSVADKLSYLVHDCDELERVVDCTWTQSYTIPSSDNKFTGEMIKKDIRDNEQQFNSKNFHQAMLYTIQLKLDSGRSIRIECDEANLQDLVYTIKGCIRQMDSFRPSHDS